MKIVKKRVKDLRFAPYNPRVMSEKERNKLKESIKAFEYVQLAVVNARTGHVVGGNQRLQVLIELGYEEIYVVEVDLSLDQEKALNLALNKISGEWDSNKLAMVIEEITQIPDFDINLTGFDDYEISRILDDFRANDLTEDGYDEKIDYSKEAITKAGDLILLSGHRLLCADASNKDDIKKVVGAKKMDLVYMDPPYSVAYDDSQRPTGKKKQRKWNPIESDNMTHKEYEAQLKNWLKNMADCLGDGAPVYIWNGHKNFGPMHLMLNELGFHIGCVITWVKERFALSYCDYNQQSEFCLYGWKDGNGAHRWYGPTNESTVWNVARDPVKELRHPTQKPVLLAHRAIKNSSKRGDVVLDMFAGSGSTLIAAEQLSRKCYAMEISPHHVDTIVQRYIKYVGEENVSKEILNKYKEDRNGRKQAR